MYLITIVWETLNFFDRVYNIRGQSYNPNIKMAGDYPYFIVALLLIHSPRINALQFTNDVPVIEEQLLEEKPILRSWGLGKTVGNCLSFLNQADCVCDLLYESEKQSLCDDFMQKWIESEHGNIFESFLALESNLPVPEIANKDDIHPLKCRILTIEKLDMEKRMYWCAPRRYKIMNTDDFGEINGFFVAGSLVRSKDRAYAFRPPQLDSENVEPVAQLDDVLSIATAPMRSLYREKCRHGCQIRGFTPI